MQLLKKYDHQSIVHRCFIRIKILLMPLYIETAPIKNSHSKSKIVPVSVTAVSSDHFHEHLTHVTNARKFLQNETIIIYDLGLTPGQVKWIKNQSNYQYRYFDLKMYPSHVAELKNYAWKIIIWAEILIEFQALVWFDSSIWFWADIKQAITETIFKKNSSWLYYIKPAAHDISSYTHPGMYSFFPSDLFKHGGDRTHMKMAGAVVMFNDGVLRDEILGWGLLCALTEDCIQPKRSRKQCNLPNNHYAYNQFGFNKSTDDVKAEMKNPIYVGELKGLMLCHRYSTLNK